MSTSRPTPSTNRWRHGTSAGRWSPRTPCSATTCSSAPRAACTWPLSRARSCCSGGPRRWRSHHEPGRHGAPVPRGTAARARCQHGRRRARRRARGHATGRGRLCVREVRPQALVRQHTQVDPTVGDVSETTETAPPTEVVDFGGLDIAFDDRVLRPRDWTAAQSHWAADLLPDLVPGAVLELCSGAGHIGLLAVAGTSRQLVCVDVSPVAAAYTLHNARLADLQAQVSVREGLVTEAVEPTETFAMVIADPPWVPQSET